MASPEMLFEKINAALKEYCGQLDKVFHDRDVISKACVAKCNNEDLHMKEQLEENTQREAKLKAFIGIAKAHSSRLVEPQGPLAFDTGKLSRLAVQINNASYNDSYAEKLYTEAVGQSVFIQQDVFRIKADCEKKKTEIKKHMQDIIASIDFYKKKLNTDVLNYLKSTEFKKLIDSLKSDYQTFSDNTSVVQGHSTASDFISIGIKRAVLSTPIGFTEEIASLSRGLYDASTQTIGLPVGISTSAGAAFVIDYTNETEGTLLSGLQKYLINIARYFENTYEQIVFVDPVRFNNSALGVLEPLASSSNSFIDGVPLSTEDIRKKLAAIIAEINQNERRKLSISGSERHRKLLIFHNFPRTYDSNMVSQIQQLCANAAHYDITVILTHNCSSRNMVSSEALEFIKTISNNIGCTSESFKWYCAPDILPADISQRYIENRTVIDKSNNYEKRLGLSKTPVYKKGIRQIADIPYGIDADGNILKLDFENSNFASFICGAARSGKSTLLHTLITGIIKNNHPDDVELWLIDFKMTEFSRYINHLPPHVRYIILDESPELVYDIIDRLTEIMTKRQNIFKGKWQKLGEVPPEKYMPAIVIIIDEFSVMSQIIADSIVSNKENYSLKLQTLLAKGAALGLHFIFSSQGFTSGTRGLNDFSKKQIQQRIAMKTEYNEIKETLDLKSASDDDRAMMEQLPVHHTLVRVPVDERGNHLLLSEVLLISDYEKQEALIDNICKLVTPAPRYDSDDAAVYIDKKSMIVDGNSYTSFMAKRAAMYDYVHNQAEFLTDDEKDILFIGEPRRMMPLYPIELVNGFCENIVLVAPINEKMAAASVLMSIAESLQLQERNIEVWTTHKNHIYRQMILEGRQHTAAVSKDLDEVCSSIRAARELIQSKSETNRFIVLLGFETLIMDMSYKEAADEFGHGTSSYKDQNNGSTVVEKRAEGELDLLSLMEALSTKVKDGTPLKSFPSSEAEAAYEEEHKNMMAYDARGDLKFILTQGPRQGYHFIMVFNSAGEVGQSKIDTSLFRHKILFRIPKADAAAIIGSTGAGIVAELEDHSFRYTNGLDELSFRPYLHPGLSWNGWQMRGSSVTNSVDEEEEYLL